MSAGKSSRRGVTTRAAAKAASAASVAPTEVIILDDDDILPVVQPAKSNRPTSAAVPLTWEDCIDEDIIEAVPVEREQHTVRVRWKNKIHRFRVYEVLKLMLSVQFEFS